MVQGWESRAHLANKRREEARERKQTKRGPQNLSGEVIINQLLNNGLVSLHDHSLEAWVENEAGGKALCYSHFRAEACLKHKRCKFSHDFTVSLNKGHTYDGSTESAAPRSEVHMDCYSDLQSIPSAQHKKLALLFLDRDCVYDKQNPLVWHLWYENALSRQQQDAAGLRTIAEGDSASVDDECESESILSLDTGVGISTGELESSFGACLRMGVSRDQKKEGMKASPPALPCPLCTLSRPLLGIILSFVSDVDICNTYVSAFTLKTAISADEFASYRRKIYLATVTPTGKDLSKLRKKEKKKKQKQSNLKDTKKGHKMVKVCRK